MNSAEKTGGIGITWGEALICWLVIPTLISAFSGSITLTIAFGFLIVAAAIVSVSESIRQAAKKTE